MPPKRKIPPPQESEESEEITTTDEEIEDEEEVELPDVMNSMILPVRRRMYGLMGLHKQYEDIMKQMYQELDQLEGDILEKQLPLLEERRKIVHGERDVTAEEIQAYQDTTKESGVEEIPDSDEEENPKKKQKKSVTIVSKNDETTTSAIEVAASKPDGGIPSFWLTALKNNEVTEGMITERDIPALECLTNVTASYIDKKHTRKGFELQFHFSENEYFTNTVLTKQYLNEDDPMSEDPDVDQIKGCEIDWKSPEKKLTVMMKTKKQRHKGGKGFRTVQREEKCPSFFNFFAFNSIDPEADIEELEDELEDYDEQLEMDFEVGSTFFSRLVPHAVQYYSGKSVEIIAASLMEGMGGMEDMDYDQDEEEEDEESEDETPAPRGRGGRGRGGAPGGRGGAAGADGQKECKQQ